MVTQAYGPTLDLPPLKEHSSLSVQLSIQRFLVLNEYLYATLASEGPNFSCRSLFFLAPLLYICWNHLTFATLTCNCMVFYARIWYILFILKVTHLLQISFFPSVQSLELIFHKICFLLQWHRAWCMFLVAGLLFVLHF